MATQPRSNGRMARHARRSAGGGVGVRLRAGVVLVLLLVALGQPRGARAVTECVNPAGSNGCLSTIQAAVNAASSGDTITVASGTYNELVTIPDSISTLTISGAGASSTILDGTGLSGTLLTNDATSLVTLSGLTLQHGTGSLSLAAGIANLGDALTLTNVTLANNTNPTGFAGGIFNEAPGSLTLTNVLLSDNSASSGDVGGIYNDFIGGLGAGTLTLTGVTLNGNSGSFAGGIYNVGTAMLTDVTMSGNSSANGTGGGLENQNTATLTGVVVSNNTGGGLFNIYSGKPVLTLTNVILAGNTGAGGINNNGGGTVTLTNGTITGNTASEGGGIFNDTGTVTLTNVTVSKNSATFEGKGGGGIYNQSGTLTLTNVTVGGNSAALAGSGGGILSGGGTVTLGSSVLATNTGGDCGGSLTISSEGYNVVDDGTCRLNGAGDLQSTGALLLPLADNSGPAVGAADQTSVLQTQALQDGSPAINHVAAATCPPPATDERGVSRPKGSACDSGAYEFDGAQCALGDTNCDGQVNATDALCVLRLVAQLASTAACPMPPFNPDVDGDKDPPPGADATDALCILRHVAHLAATAACPTF